MEEQNAWQTRHTMTVLEAAASMMRELGASPTRQALADRLELKSKSGIQKHLDKLRDGGLIEMRRAGRFKLTPMGILQLDIFRAKRGR